MAPSRIQNGDEPNADQVMAWFDYIGGGTIFNTINMDTLANLKAAAQAAPSTAFMCIATDQGAGGQLYCYLGNTLAGDGGFVLLGG